MTDFTRECSSAAMLQFMSICKNILSIIQIVVPILLILSASIGFWKLVKNPEEKNGTKKIINKGIAAAIIYLIPVFLNATMNMVGVKTNVSTCWTNADEFRLSSSSFKPIQEEEKKSLIPSSEDYEEGNGISSTAAKTCGEKIAKLAVELAGTASPEAFIKSPSGKNYCAFNKSNDPRLQKYNEVHDSRVSCNHAYASCTQAAATIIDAAADPEINWMGPAAQLYYLQHSSKWQELEKPANGSWKEVLQPGDVGEIIWDSSGSGHSWIYVGNEIAKTRFPNTDGYIYDGGYSSCKNPHISPNSGLIGNDSRIHYFRFIGDCQEAETKNVKDGYGGPSSYSC